MRAYSRALLMVLTVLTLKLNLAKSHEKDRISQGNTTTQTNQLHREEETQITYSQMAFKRQLK